MAEFEQTGSGAGAGIGGAIAAAIERDARAWAGLHCEMLSGVERLWSESLRRQVEAVEIGARTLQGLYGRQLAATARLQREWLADATRRAADALGQSSAEAATAVRDAASAAERTVAAANESMPRSGAERVAAE